MNIPCIIDFHVHMPGQLSRNRSIDPANNAKALLREMNKLGVCKAVLIAIETNVDVFKYEVSKEKIYKGLEELVAEGYLALPGYLSKFLEDLDEFYEEHLNLLKIAHTPSEIVMEIARDYGDGRILPVIAPDLNQPRKTIIERTARLLKEGALGIKLLPTINFIKGKHKEILEDLAELLLSYNGLLIIHTGCDPGIWELPYFCKGARPQRFEWLIRKYRDLIIVLAHMGAYSALKPGIFVHEAIELVKRYDNVYGDTAALDRNIIEYIVSHVGAGRILFGSDYPVVVGASWHSLVGEILSAKISSQDKEKILYFNARDVLRAIGRDKP